MRPRSRRPRILLLFRSPLPDRALFGALGVLITGLGACGASAGAHELHEETPSAVAVTEVDAEAGTVLLSEASREFIEVETVGDAGRSLELRLPARVVFREEALARVGAPVSGRVVEVHVTPGDRVVVGQALVTLRSPEAAESRAALAADSAALAAARRAAERARRMIDDGVGTERELVEAEARVAELEADVARGRAIRGMLGSGSGATLVLRAPIEGLVLSRAATVGSAVTAGEGALVEVGDPSRSWLEADVYERELELIEEGERVRVELVALAQPLEGTVVRIGAVVDPTSRATPVRIALDAAPTALRPGMAAWAHVAVRDAGVTVPRRSVLVLDGRRHGVFVQGPDGAFVRREVEVGASIGERIQIRSGLSPTDRVVVRGALLLDGEADLLL